MRSNRYKEDLGDHKWQEAAYQPHVPYTVLSPIPIARYGVIEVIPDIGVLWSEK